MGLIKQLTQFITGVKIYPITKSNAVYDDTLGRLDTALMKFVVEEEEFEVDNDTGLRDADTLEGHTSEYFAKKTDVEKFDSKINNVNNNLGGLRFGTDGEGNGGYFKGDDTFIPFKKGITLKSQSITQSGSISKSGTTKKAFTFNELSSVTGVLSVVENSTNKGTVLVSGIGIDGNIVSVTLKNTYNSGSWDYKYTVTAIEAVVE